MKETRVSQGNKRLITPLIHTAFLLFFLFFGLYFQLFLFWNLSTEVPLINTAATDNTVLEVFFPSCHQTITLGPVVLHFSPALLSLRSTSPNYRAATHDHQNSPSTTCHSSPVSRIFSCIRPPGSSSSSPGLELPPLHSHLSPQTL